MPTHFRPEKCDKVALALKKLQFFSPITRPSIIWGCLKFRSSQLRPCQCNSSVFRKIHNFTLFWLKLAEKKFTKFQHAALPDDSSIVWCKNIVVSKLNVRTGHKIITFFLQCFLETFFFSIITPKNFGGRNFQI